MSLLRICRLICAVRKSHCINQQTVPSISNKMRLPLQVQKLKVDTESAMLEIDQILKANELSIALVAAVPSFLIAGVSVVGIWRWLSPKPVDPKYEALPCRCDCVQHFTAQCNMYFKQGLAPEVNLKLEQYMPCRCDRV